MTKQKNVGFNMPPRNPSRHHEYRQKMFIESFQDQCCILLLPSVIIHYKNVYIELIAYDAFLQC